jgi:hypothetical protein
VAKVKKRAAVTGIRNVKAGKGTKPPVRKTAKKGSAKKGSAKKGSAKKGFTRKGPMKLVRSKKKESRPAKGRRIVKAVPLPVVRIAVRELDPQRKCGEGTSVQFLYRVDETVDGRATAHLVFFDRHGWYCEHGRTCPAVAHAKKHNGRIARVS